MKKKSCKKTNRKKHAKKKTKHNKLKKQTNRSCKFISPPLKSHSTSPPKITSNFIEHGNDGCIVHSIQHEQYSKENDYIAKLITQKNSNMELHAKLQKIDPNNKRFTSYYGFIPICQIKNNPDIKRCQQQFNDKLTHVVFMKKNIPFAINTNTSKQPLTKQQYRYLRTSVEILNENNIIHGDLPGNVMLNEEDNMPRIIDWDNAFFITLNTHNEIKSMDKNTFLQHFYVKT